MPTCKECRAEIIFIRTKAGRAMPCNTAAIAIIPDKDGDIYGVTCDGEVIRGVRAAEKRVFGVVYQYVHISHFATCPAAGKFRKG